MTMQTAAMYNSNNVQGHSSVQLSLRWGEVIAAAKLSSDRCVAAEILGSQKFARFVFPHILKDRVFEFSPCSLRYA